MITLRPLLSLTTSIFLMSACAETPGVITLFTVSAERSVLAPGDSMLVAAQVEGTGKWSTFANWAVTPETAGRMRNPFSAGSAFLASEAVTDATPVVIRAVSYTDPTQAAELNITVTPNLVRSIEIVPARSAVAPDKTVNLRAKVLALGTASAEVAWKVESGGGILSAERGETVAFTAAGLVAGSKVKVVATSVGMPGVFGAVELSVVELPVVQRFSSSKMTLPGGGGLVDLTWTVSGAEKVMLSPEVGEVTENSKTVDVRQKTAFVLTASNAAGSDSKTVEVKVENQGVLEWVRYFGVPGSKNYGVVSDEQGNVYVVGGTAENSSCGLIAGLNDVFVLKYNLDGTRQWCRQFGTPANDIGVDLVADKNQNVYVVGSTAGKLGSIVSGDQDAFIAKLNRNGQTQWVSQFGSNAYDVGNSVILTKSATLAVGGLTRGVFGSQLFGELDMFLSELDLQGNVLSKSQFGSASDDVVWDLFEEDGGSFSVAGSSVTGKSDAGQKLKDLDVWSLSKIGERAGTTKLGSVGESFIWSNKIEGRMNSSVVLTTITGAVEARSYRSSTGLNWTSQLESAGLRPEYPGPSVTDEQGRTIVLVNHQFLTDGGVPNVADSDAGVDGGTMTKRSVMTLFILDREGRTVSISNGLAEDDLTINAARMDSAQNLFVVGSVQADGTPKSRAFIAKFR